MGFDGIRVWDCSTWEPIDEVTHTNGPGQLIDNAQTNDSSV
ncbi:unnamed protein product, partial [Adineta ricciae]